MHREREANKTQGLQQSFSIAVAMPPYIRYADFEATDHQILKTLAALLEMHLDLRSMVNVSNLIFLHAFLLYMHNCL